MVEISEKDLQDVQDTFNLFDFKGDGKIEAKDIGELVRALGLNPTESDISKYGYQDRPHERIGFETFVPIYRGLIRERIEINPESFIEAFRVFDKEGNGLVSTAELRFLLTSLGESLSEEEVDILLSGMECNPGHVSYEAFVKRVLS